MRIQRTSAGRIPPAWANGWWSGIAVGFVIGISCGVFLYEVAKMVK